MAIPNKALAAVALVTATAAWGWWALAAEDEPAPAATAPAGQFAASLRGTTVDGNVRASAGGALVLDQELLRLFDYYLATLGERDLKAVRAAVATQLQQRLSGAALRAALDLFDRYLQYKQALGDLEKQLAGKAGRLAERLAAVRALRLRFFSAEETQGLFGHSDTYDEFTVKRLQLLEDKNLNAAAKVQRLRELENQLPTELREARQAPVKHIVLAEAEAALRQQGKGEQEIYALRVQQVGPAAAERLAALDREQAQWQARIDSYLAARRQVLADGGKNEQQKQAAIAELAASQFSALEQKRLGAYEGQ